MKLRDNSAQLCKDVDLLISHIRDKPQTCCNLTADREHKHGITRKEIYGSYYFTDNIYLALPKILQLIWADKPAYSTVKLIQTDPNDKKTFIQ